MLAIICAAILSLPLYPLNPPDNDTANTMSLHVTAGISGQSAMISPGPEFTLKYEYLFEHPYIFRTSLDYLYGEISSNTDPNGDVHRHTISSEVLYYRGSNNSTAYIGLGIVYGRGIFTLTDSSYFDDDDIVPQEINFNSSFGYRFLLGMHFNKKYSLEITVTEISPSMTYIRIADDLSFSEETTDFRANYFKISLGYLFKLR